MRMSHLCHRIKTTCVRMCCTSFLFSLSNCLTLKFSDRIKHKSLNTICFNTAGGLLLFFILLVKCLLTILSFGNACKFLTSYFTGQTVYSIRWFDTPKPTFPNFLGLFLRTITNSQNIYLGNVVLVMFAQQRKWFTFDEWIYDNFSRWKDVWKLGHRRNISFVF